MIEKIINYGTKTKNRSAEAQRMHAEAMLNAASNLSTTFFITILIVPMGAIAKMFLTPDYNVPAMLPTLFKFITSEWVILFIVLETSIAYLANDFKKNALDIIDELNAQNTLCQEINKNIL